MRHFASWSGVTFVLLIGMAGATQLAAQSPAPCETDERYRALDFLLGEWRLVSGGDGDDEAATGEVVGRSSVEKLENECLIAETWAFADGRSGRTFSSFDASDGVWRRFSVSNHGVLVRTSGEIKDSELMVRGDWTSADGGSRSWRERLAPVAGGRVRWVAGHSDRRRRGDRVSAVEFSGYYDPVGGPGGRQTDSPPPAESEPSPLPAEPRSSGVPAEPAPRRVPAAPEPAPAPAEPGAAPAPAAGEVTAVSPRATDAANIERIAMASPMVLRLPLGTVEALPEGYAWITRDTAPYLCESVTIERLEVSRRERRGRVELVIEVAVHSTRVNRGVEIGVDLRRADHADGSVVASGSVSGRAGRGLPEQIEHGSVALEVSMSMTAEDFGAAVADPERPELLITLAVAK